jgi:hypothetical protein
MNNQDDENLWSGELEKMKKSIREARTDFKQSNDINDKIRVKKCKKEFRKAQRRNMFIYEINNKYCIFVAQ